MVIVSFQKNRTAILVYRALQEQFRHLDSKHRMSLCDLTDVERRIEGRIVARRCRSGFRVQDLGFRGLGFRPIKRLQKKTNYSLI